MASLDPFDSIRAEVMLEGYTARWADEDLEPLAVEVEFQLPDGTAGKLDVLASREGRYLYPIEHKTSTGNVGYYWRRLALDSQVSTYFKGAHALAGQFGYEQQDVRGIEYDVLIKPGLDPYKATPPEKRKFSKKTGQLYANQRERDETPDEYRARLREALKEEPDRYFQRQPIVRTPSELEEATGERNALRFLMSGSHLGLRNPDACVRYGRLCEYWGVCAGETSLDDPALFRTAEKRHEELSTSLPVVTNSELSCFRRCQREHLYRYQLLRRPLEDAHVLRYGRLVHLGLEAWWRQRMSTKNPALLLAAAVKRMREETQRGERGEHEAARVAE